MANVINRLGTGSHYLEDHPRTCKWLEWAPHLHAMDGNPILIRGLTITMVINHVLNGMILQVAIDFRCVSVGTLRAGILSTKFDPYQTKHIQTSLACPNPIGSMGFVIICLLIYHNIPQPIFFVKINKNLYMDPNG